MRLFFATVLGCAATISATLVLTGFAPNGASQPTPVAVGHSRESTSSPFVQPASVASPVPTVSEVVVLDRDGGVLVIGDSILESLHRSGKSFGSRTLYDTEVSRSILALPEALSEVEDTAPGIPGNVVIHLGSNGFWPEAEELLDTAMIQLADRRVVLVNVAVDRPWAASANEAITAVAGKHDHVRLLDWKARATDDLLRSDGVHPNFQGIDVLHRMIAEELGLEARSPLPVDGAAPSRVLQ